MAKTTGKTRLELRKTKLALETAKAQHTQEIQKLKTAMARLRAGKYDEPAAVPMSRY